VDRVSDKSDNEDDRIEGTNVYLIVLDPKIGRVQIADFCLRVVCDLSNACLAA